MPSNRTRAAVAGLVLALASIGFTARADAQQSEEVTLSEFTGTQRDGILSGGYIAVDLGILAPRQGARERAGIGLGPGFHLRAGVEFWDHLVIGVGIALYQPTDNKPTSELVVTCSTFEGREFDCGEPRSESSGIWGSFAFVESGYQHRFRPWVSSSLTPGALMGLAAEVQAPHRGVACEGCADAVALPISTSSVYVAPFLRVTIGERGIYAVIARSQLFVTSDLAHFTTLGAEFGLP